jgi:cytochrome c-type biogenesis protein CcmH/NrfG
VFELNRPEEAIVHLERYIQLQPSNTQAMFVLARAHFMMEKYKEAIEVYDRIILRTKVKTVKEEASFNRDIIMGMMYG